jgi:phosphoglycolate phosphatase-like HAD superfamily hydrolase
MMQRHDFLIAIDSDGSAFDTMEIKHKACIIPNIIKHWHLQPICNYVRRAAEFVNLYSQSRGSNRFSALIKVFDLLSDWPELKQQQAIIPQAKSLRRWIHQEARLCHESLRRRADETNDPELLQAWTWSDEVNRSVEEMIIGIPPFPLVRESLEKISSWADIVVCSVTTVKELEREWQEHSVDRHVSMIAGQEMGSKAEIIRQAADGRYQPEKILMIGDAPGDKNAAWENQARFYPINPGHEEQSWALFYQDGADRFCRGQYHADFESGLLEKFDKLLPTLPPWKLS